MPYPRVASPPDNPPATRKNRLAYLPHPYPPPPPPVVSWSRLFIAFLRWVFSSCLASFHHRIWTIPQIPHTCSILSLRSYLGFHSGLHTHLTSLTLSDLSCIVYPAHTTSLAVLPSHFTHRNSKFILLNNKKHGRPKRSGCLSHILLVLVHFA